MGSTAFVKPAAQIRRSLRLGYDVSMLLAVACLLVFGLLMVYSASWNVVLRRGEAANSILNRQILWVVGGGIMAAIISLIDYHRYVRLIVPVMILTVLMLFVVLLVGSDPNSPRRGLFGGSIQPSEMAKLAIILYLSLWLYSKRETLQKITLGLLPLLSILGITAGLILLEPDLSAAITIVFMGGLLFFLAGGDLKQVILVVVVASILGYLVVSVSSTGRQRLNEYLLGLQSPENAAYQVRRTMEAVARGGFFGVGIGNSVTKFTGLPVPWTDSIYAVIVEETGLVGGVIVIGLFMVILWRGLTIANRAPDLLGRLLASGLTLWIVIEALINVGVLVNLIPVAGNALPLVSAGGSNMTMVLVAVGIVMSVARTSQNEQTAQGGKTFGAVVDLRWRDRRRRVSRADRSASARR
jgi:cell division protein FtsW